MENFFEEKKKRKINTKKVVLASIIALLIIAIITVIIVYCNSAEFRRWADKNVLRKEIKQVRWPNRKETIKTTTAAAKRIYITDVMEYLLQRETVPSKAEIRTNILDEYTRSTVQGEERRTINIIKPAANAGITQKNNCSKYLLIEDADEL